MHTSRRLDRPLLGRRFARAWFAWAGLAGTLLATGCTSSDPSAGLPDLPSQAPDAPSDAPPGSNGPSSEREPSNAWTPTPGAERLPSPERWRQHLTQEILPYWTMPSALGEPVGNFPTFRCNDGTVYAADTRPCPELHQGPEWIRSELGREFVRMKSRQTYGYGAAFHITGDPRLLELHLAGVRWLLENAMVDEGRGGAVTFFEDGRPDAQPRLRTSQDQAYAALGLAMNYYLTRDPTVLAVLDNLERHIFSQYFSPELGLLRWTPEGDALELVAQLDQLNAYLLLVEPVLPEALRARWDADIHRVVEILETRFHSGSLDVFYGAITRPEDLRLGTPRTDFGHTIKSYWMIYLAGRLLDEPRWRTFAVEGSIATLSKAYITEGTRFGDAGPFVFERDVYLGAWAEGYTGQEGADVPGSVWPGSEWWSYAELDQVAATWLVREAGHPALAELDLLGKLETTHARWFERLVDPVFGGIYHRRVNRGQVENGKCHLWKNAYHEIEHALVGLIAASALRAEPLDLYFAFHPDAENEKVVPYFFEGEATVDQAPPVPSALRSTSVGEAGLISRARFTHLR